MLQKRYQWGVWLVAIFAFWLANISALQAAPLAVDTARIYGSTRIETAIKISQEGWESADTVLLARADDFPDSLVSVPLSKKLDAPILLTFTKELDADVLAEMNRLGAKHVIILGGAGVMGQEITKPLEKAKLSWERIGGSDRYETGALVAERFEGSDQVLVASGETFPDALAIGPYAGMTESPILLTRKNFMPDFTRRTLEDFGAYEDRKAIVVGGEGAVSPNAVAGLSQIRRIAGENRFETAAEIYRFAQGELGTDDLITNYKVYLVTSDNFPDALVTGALAAKENSFLFMSRKDYLPPVTYTTLGEISKLNMLVLIGGKNVISNEIQEILQGSRNNPYLLGNLTIVLDPGHGGKDVGAVGPSGSHEKNSTLPVGKYLADLLRDAGATVILTREGDYSPAGGDFTELEDLQARVKIANQKKADLFVSIHNDAFSNPEAGGITTYISAANPKYKESQELAQAVQRELVEELELYDRKVKNANFYVVKNTNMPAILVELGFISNPNEEKLITSPEFQKKAARGIYQGILNYELTE